MWKGSKLEILPGHTYEFKSGDSCLRVELVMLMDGQYSIIPRLIIRGHNKEGVKAFLSMLPMKGDLDHTSFTLQSGVDIAVAKGWKVNDLNAAA